MNADDHVREELGAYVLGGLEPAQRRAVDLHVQACASCRDELARLSGLPALLDRLSPDEAFADLAEVPATIGPRISAEVASAARELHRQVRRWRWATAAAAAIAGLLVAVPLVSSEGPQEPAPEPLTALLQPVASDAEATAGQVAAYAWEWGTTVEIEVSGLPARSRYAVWVAEDGGEPQLAGTWGPTTTGDATVRSASAIPRDRLTTVEVRDDTGEVLLGAQLP